ncbi:MAG: SpoIID/LytB domain-containing protein [Candidatus Omnitrophica bacterium]|nr:SpoIID/LytB domain-containing protein [Candidatus Omnitrophota bacterium]
MKYAYSILKNNFLTFGFCLAFCFLHFTLCYASGERFIRVKIIDDSASLALAINGGYEVIDYDSQKSLAQGTAINTTVTSYKNRINIGSNDFGASRLFIKAGANTEISLNGRCFRGAVLFLRKSGSAFYVINYLELEDYIKGVLFHETSHYWPDEVLKAQAIVCRTFALYQMQQNTKNDFDVTSDIYSQMYGGSTSERYRTNRAVAETKGVVLTYNNKIFPAYYHATCAGHTEDASLLWGINIPPLKGVVCGFCKDSPHFNWHEVTPQDDVKWTLRKAGIRLKKIKNIEIEDKDASGRITNLIFKDSDKEAKISAKDFRNLVGPNVIRSTIFKVSLEGDDIIFEGVGWGHGVGMCQWGAYFMAKEGKSYQDILKYYYPGAEISLNAR